MSEQWIRVASEEAVPEGDVVGVEAGGEEVALYKIAGAVYATDNTCTHGQARLCDGFVDGYEIECPLHQGKFDVRSGKALCAPATEAIRSYPVKVEGGVVYVAVEL